MESMRERERASDEEGRSESFAIGLDAMTMIHRLGEAGNATEREREMWVN